MGFDPDRIPMIRGAAHLERYPLTDQSPGDHSISVNGHVRPMVTLRGGVGRKFRPAKEWSTTL
jgi:hypothetical protein